MGSSGGHLAQLLPLRAIIDPEDRSWVTFCTPDAVGALSEEVDVVWAYHPTTRNLRNLMRNAVLALKFMRTRRPDIVVTTGAAVAFPFFVLSRFYGARTVYIEVFDRVDSSTLTAKLCSPFADAVLVQWPEQVTLFRESELIGPLL